MNTPRPNVLAIQSFGYIQNSLDMSPGAMGSRARLLHAVNLVSSGKISTDGLIAVFPQGVSKSDPLGLSSNAASLGKDMADYLAGQPDMASVRIFHEPLGWGTMADVQNTYKMVRSLGYSTAHLIFVSDPVHIKRVKIVWEWTKPQAWSAEFHAAEAHRMSRKERWIREPIARIVYRLRLLRFEGPIQVSMPE